MDRLTKEARSKNMSQIKSKNTKPEVLVRKYLFSRRLRFRKNDKRYPGCPDIILPKYRTIIFVNGCFWHGHENCTKSSLPKTNKHFWENKLRLNKERDDKNHKTLLNEGWKVITIWECELVKSLRDKRMEELYHDIVQNNNDSNG